jgi:hypothetical protein
VFAFFGASAQFPRLGRRKLVAQPEISQTSSCYAAGCILRLTFNEKIKEKKDNMKSEEQNSTDASVGASFFSFEITLIVDHEGCC